ncbi:unnamed protein product, partial [Ilex paraguariensis]
PKVTSDCKALRRPTRNSRDSSGNHQGYCRCLVLTAQFSGALRRHSGDEQQLTTS